MRAEHKYKFVENQTGMASAFRGFMPHRRMEMLGGGAS